MLLTSICDSYQGRLCSQGVATQPHFNGVVVGELEQ